jgi:hypothetical protein
MELLAYVLLGVLFWAVVVWVALSLVGGQS